MADKTQTKEPALVLESTSELVLELKETVKKLEPKRHTPKTLHRQLSLIQDILNDIMTINDKTLFLSQGSVTTGPQKAPSKN